LFSPRLQRLARGALAKPNAFWTVVIADLAGFGSQENGGTGIVSMLTSKWDGVGAFALDLFRANDVSRVDARPYRLSLQVAQSGKRKSRKSKTQADPVPR
jgi:hypothetical protein